MSNGPAFQSLKPMNEQWVQSYLNTAKERGESYLETESSYLHFLPKHGTDGRSTTLDDYTVLETDPKGMVGRYLTEFDILCPGEPGDTQLITRMVATDIGAIHEEFERLTDGQECSDCGEEDHHYCLLKTLYKDGRFKHESTHNSSPEFNHYFLENQKGKEEGASTENDATVEKGPSGRRRS